MAGHYFTLQYSALSVSEWQLTISMPVNLCVPKSASFFDNNFGAFLFMI